MSQGHINIIIKNYIYNKKRTRVCINTLFLTLTKTTLILKQNDYSRINYILYRRRSTDLIKGGIVLRSRPF